MELTPASRGLLSVVLMIADREGRILHQKQFLQHNPDERERVWLERLLGYLQRNNDAEPLELAKYSAQRRTGVRSELLVKQQ